MDDQWAPAGNAVPGDIIVGSLSEHRTEGPSLMRIVLSNNVTGSGTLACNYIDALQIVTKQRFGVISIERWAPWAVHTMCCFAFKA